MKTIEVEYRFEPEDRPKRVIRVVLDAQSLQAVNAPSDALPGWTELGFYQCPNCPLMAADHPQCPAAAGMAGLVTPFKETFSFDQALVVVLTAERVVYSHTTMQKGLCSLMGLIMATSGCPHTAFFKPLARFHLPFANTQETIWRAASMYLMAQYFQKQAGAAIDLRFKGLREIYSRMRIVNQAFARRLRAAFRQDAMVNGIILLDLFAQSLPEAIEASLEEIRYLFTPYLLQMQMQSTVTERVPH